MTVKFGLVLRWRLDVEMVEIQAAQGGTFDLGRSDLAGNDGLGHSNKMSPDFLFRPARVFVCADA